MAAKSGRGGVAAAAACYAQAVRHLGVAIAASLLAAPARAEIAEVWAVDDGTKVRADAPDHPLARGNGAFEAEPPRVKLFGLRNETVAFQVILVGGDGETTGVSVKLGSIGPIANRSDGEADPDRYWLGRRIELFDQRYLEVTVRSHDMVWKPWSDAQPADMSGPIPDALEPHRGALTVPARRAQGVWIDVYIPKDAPRGTHRGTVAIDVGGVPCALPACRLPVELEVLDVALPDVTATKTMVWFSGGEGNRDSVAARYFDEPEKASLRETAALRRRHFALARRHRVTLIVGEEDAPTPELAALLDGSMFSTEAGYDGPGVSVPDGVYAIHAYGGELTAAAAKEWAAWFELTAPSADYFLYVIDEPHDPALFPAINEIARRAEPVPAFVTHPFTHALDCDIFCALPADFSQATARDVGESKRLWIYNGVRPFSGTFVTDDVAISPRVNAWIQHKYGIGRWFYWEATYYRDFQGGRGHVDVWREANNFRTRFGDRINGDGLLMYPGRDRRYPAEDRGIDRPLPSIRLKAWRRGIEDVEYLRLCEKAGHGAFARQLVDTLVPRALADETEADEPVSWPEDGEPWLAARRVLFDTLAAGSPPQVDLAALARPPEALWPRARRALHRVADPLLRSTRRRLATGAALAALAAALFFVLRRRRRAAARLPPPH
jgi:hypothetical protein